MDNQPNLKVLERFSVLLETHDKVLPTTFFVINTDHKNLMSRIFILALGIIQINQTGNLQTKKLWSRIKNKSKP